MLLTDISVFLKNFSEFGFLSFQVFVAKFFDWALNITLYLIIGLMWLN